MKYWIDFQYLRKGFERPIDQGSVVGIEVDGDHGYAAIPNVGDYVEVILSGRPDQEAFMGRVRSRLFRYFVVQDQTNCSVNVVVEETDDDWGKLIKE